MFLHILMTSIEIKLKILIVFDDMITDIISNKNLS